MRPIAQPDPEALAYVRHPNGRIDAEHRAAGQAPLGADADERMAAAVRNWQQAVENVHWGVT